MASRLKKAVRQFAIEMGFVSRRPGKIGTDLAVDLGRIHPLTDFSLILDVGANEGQTARRFAALAPQAKIISFEPIGSAYRQLEETARSLPNVRPAHSAVGDQVGEVTFQLKSNSRWNSLVPELNQPERGSGYAETRPIVTLDDYCRENNHEQVDLLKSDTEGWDLHVLVGARELLSSGNVAFAFIEVSFEKVDPSHSYFTDIASYLDSFGFRFLALYDISWTSSPWRFSFANALFTSL